MNQLIVLFLLTNYYTTAQISSKLYVGEMDNSPVFDAFAEKRLYILGNDSLYTIPYPKDYRVIGVKNTVILFEERLNNGKYNVILNSGEQEQKYLVNTNLTYCVLSDRTIAFTDQRDVNKIKIIKDGQLTETKSIGYVTAADSLHIYFTTESPMSISDVDMDLYKINLSDFTVSLVWQHIAGENLIVFKRNDQNYFFDHILYEGSYRRALFNESSGKHALFSVDISNKLIFYSNRTENLTSYNPQTLELEIIPFPEKW